MLWPTCSGPDNASGMDTGCSIVFKYGMKRDFNQWLASLGSAAPVETLTELRAWNPAHERAGALKYGQAQLDISDEMDLERDRARYEADRAKDIALSGPEGIDAALRASQARRAALPGQHRRCDCRQAGLPDDHRALRHVPNAPTPPLPAAFDARPAPFGVSFTGTACSEPRLIELAYAFEQATKRRVPPSLD